MHHPPLTSQDWRLLISNIQREECVPFLGAGASLGFDESPGLPTAGELAKELAEECGYGGHDKGDFFRVCQYFSMVQDPHSLRVAIRDKLSVPGVKPSIVHKTLAALPLHCVLTTNFDDLMEQAFRDVGKHPASEVYYLQGDASELKPPTVNEPLVYKLHGTIEELHTMIVTEDDVISFMTAMLTSEPQLPPEIKAMLKNHSILFLGYGLKDWNIRVMLRGLRGSRHAPPPISSFAIQRAPTEQFEETEWEQSVIYWKEKERVRCFDVNALEFAKELTRKYQGE